MADFLRGLDEVSNVLYRIMERRRERPDQLREIIFDNEVVVRRGALK